MDHLNYFALQGDPFAPTADGEACYCSKAHADALRRLWVCINSMRGLALLVSEPGCGKSTLARALWATLQRDHAILPMLLVAHMGVSPRWFLTQIAQHSGVNHPSDDHEVLLKQIEESWVQLHHQGRRAVVLVDEAQLLASRALMEEVRHLLNLEVPHQKLVTFVLFALHDIDEYLQLDPLLWQRVATRCHLPPLDFEDTQKYVQHRLQLAGAQRAIFGEEALRCVHDATHGVPRLINILCDNVLLEAFFVEQSEPTPRLIAEVATTLGLARLAELVAKAPPAPHDVDWDQLAERVAEESLPEFDPADCLAALLPELDSAPVGSGPLYAALEPNPKP